MVIKRAEGALALVFATAVLAGCAASETSPGVREFAPSDEGPELESDDDALRRDRNTGEIFLNELDHRRSFTAALGDSVVLTLPQPANATWELVGTERPLGESFPRAVKCNARARGPAGCVEFRFPIAFRELAGTRNSVRLGLHTHGVRAGRYASTFRFTVRVKALPVAQRCGGLLGATCPTGTACIYAIGDQCGAADQMGTCQAVGPKICTMDYAPVCGCDDVTYSNACEASSKGVSLVAVGECPKAPQACGTRGSAPCGEQEYCKFPSGSENTGNACGANDRGGECAPVPLAFTCSFQPSSPVLGCDGTRYDNECFAAAAGTSVLGSATNPR